MKVMSMLLAAIVVAWRADGQTQLGFAVNFVAPSGSSNVEGNFASGAPVTSLPATSVRYQQVYAASEFAFLTNFGGGWLMSVIFRGDATNGYVVGVQIPSMQVNLSTTQRAPDDLSSTFADNVGPDDTIVYSGSLGANVVGLQGGPGPIAFDSFEIDFSNLFYYKPTQGNLLLDFRIYQGNTITNTMGRMPVFDAVNLTNDSVSRVWWGDVNASTGLVETIGLPTQLFFWPNPKLHVQLQTNSVGLWWPTNPTSFVFQTSQNLAPQTQWQNITTGIMQSNAINTYTIPITSTASTAYFRLISTTPP